MVVSLTIIPVLAARFLGRRPMPTTGPIYNLLADGYEGLLKVGLRFPMAGRAAGAAGGRAGLVALPAPGDRLHARHGRRGVRARLQHAGRHLAGPDRQGAAAGRGGAPADARHLRLHPPDRGRARLLRHRAVHRRHPGEPQAARPAPADERDLRRRSARSWRTRSPSWRPSSCRWSRTRSTTWRASTARSRSRSSAPTSRHSASWPRRSARSSRKIHGAADVNAHVFLGNPDIVDPARQRPDGAGRPDGDGRREPSSTPRSTARWPARSPSRTG